MGWYQRQQEILRETRLVRRGIEQFRASLLARPVTATRTLLVLLACAFLIQFFARWRESTKFSPAWSGRSTRGPLRVPSGATSWQHDASWKSDSRCGQRLGASYRGRACREALWLSPAPACPCSLRCRWSIGQSLLGKCSVFSWILWSALRSLRSSWRIGLTNRGIGAASRRLPSIPSPGLRNPALECRDFVFTDDRCCCSFRGRSSWIYAGGDSQYQTLTRVGRSTWKLRGLLILLLAGMVASYVAFLKESEPWVLWEDPVEISMQENLGIPVPKSLLSRPPSLDQTPDGMTMLRFGEMGDAYSISAGRRT